MAVVVETRRIPLVSDIGGVTKEHVADAVAGGLGVYPT